MARPSEERPLARSAQRSIALLALLALLFAQAAAGLHALKHLSTADSSRVPDAHAQLCLACVSFAPIASAHGGTVASVFAGVPVAAFVAPVDSDVRVESQLVVSFRSRAPPPLLDA